MDPISYWPVELALDCTMMYIFLNSNNVYEKIFLTIAFFIHVERQVKNWGHIMEVSNKRSRKFLWSIVFGSICTLLLSRIIHWPFPIVLAVMTGWVYFTLVKMFINDSGEKFKLVNPMIDYPQTIISCIMSYNAIALQNPISIFWVSDFVYHIIEIMS